MNYDIAITSEQQVLIPDEASIRATVQAVLHNAGVTQAVVSVALVDNEAIRQLKAAYFNRDEVTDVISFDLRDDDASINIVDCEVVVNAQRAWDVTGDETAAVAELHLYIVHGLLHQLGFDDDTPEHAQVMHAQEDDILRRLNFGNVFSRPTGERC